MRQQLERPQFERSQIEKQLAMMRSSHNSDQTEQKLYMSNLENKPIHKIFRVTISSFKYAKNTNTDIISQYVYNNSPCKLTITLGLLGYCETNATFHLTQERSIRVNKTLKLTDICQSTILDEEIYLYKIK